MRESTPLPQLCRKLPKRLPFVSPHPEYQSLLCNWGTGSSREKSRVMGEHQVNADLMNHAAASFRKAVHEYWGHFTNRFPYWPTGTLHLHGGPCSSESKPLQMNSEHMQNASLTLWAWEETTQTRAFSIMLDKVKGRL